MSRARVVIVGAGIAGLKAAATLSENGVADCVVLEARDRIGGRLHTVAGFDGKRMYDLGASWHHDTLCNELFDEECGAEDGAPFIFDDDFHIFIDRHIGRVDRDPQMRLEIVDSEISKFADIEFHQKLGVADCSFFELILRYLYEKQRFLTDDQIRYAPQVARFLELWHGFDWKSLSAKDTYFGHQGRNALVLNFDDVSQRVAKPIPEEWIKLNTDVNSITRSGSEVVVTTTDSKTYVADYCIVTIPQSVLELSVTETKPMKGRIEFNPPLKKSIQKGFDKMHVGALGKVIFEFDKCNWSLESTKIVTLAQTEESFVSRIRKANSFGELLKQVELKEEIVEVPDCWDHPLYFINLPKVNGVPSLMMIMQEPLSRYVEKIQDNKDKVFEFFQPVLDKLMTTLGGKPVLNGMGHRDETSESHPVLKNVLVSSWTTDEYSRGAYTACKPGDDGVEMIVALGDGQDSRIRFAGEHTIMDGAGCVYGAWESGKREANYILDNE